MGKKNAISACYIVTFVKRAKELQRIGVKKRNTIGGRNPRESRLWQLLDNHFDEFEYRYDDLLYEEAKSKRERTPPFHQTVETVIEPYDDGGHDYEEPFINVQTL